VSWLSELLRHHEPKTFHDDLSLLIARWTDYSRKGHNAMTIKQIGEALLDRAEAILDSHGKK